MKKVKAALLKNNTLFRNFYLKEDILIFKIEYKFEKEKLEVSKNFHGKLDDRFSFLIWVNTYSDVEVKHMFELDESLFEELDLIKDQEKKFKKLFGKHFPELLI